MKIVSASIIYGFAVCALLFFEDWLVRHTEHVPVTGWLTDHVYLPLLRAAAIVLFILAAYPELYGMPAAPPLAEVLAAQPGWFTHLLNLLFVLSLLLPLLPGIGVLPPVILPLQGCAAATLLFHWLTADLGIRDIRLVPEGEIIIGFALICAAGHFAARSIAQFMQRQSIVQGVEKLWYEGLVLAFQAPAILLYTHGLGAQLR